MKLIKDFQRMCIWNEQRRERKTKLSKYIQPIP